MKKEGDMKKKYTLQYLYQVTGKNKMEIVLMIVIQMFLGASSVWFAMLLRGALDGAVGKYRSVFWNYTVLAVLVVLLQISLRGFVRFLKEHGKAAIENALKKRLFHNLLHRDYGMVVATHSGEWMNRMTSDTTIVANGAIEILPSLAEMLVKMTGAFTMILVLEIRFAYVMIPGGVLMLLFTYMFRRRLKRLHKNVQETDGAFRVFVQEQLGSLPVLKAFTKENVAEDRALSKMNEHKKARMKRNHFSNFCNIGFAFAMRGMYLMGFIYCGYGILQGTISYGTLLAMIQLISQIQSPFANITGFMPRYYAMIASAERLMEIEAYREDEEVLLQEPDFEKIQVSSVDFSYGEEGAKVLENISLTINRGDYVAFTGHSGCGKSTVMKLLLSLYQVDKGELFLEDFAGKHVPVTSGTRGLFAYVPQGNLLMNGTIREVVTFGEEPAKVDEEKLRRVLAISCVDDFISEMGEGIDTLLGERGAGISEGQMQRISIARALYSDRPVLLLDEATSALDERTEERLLNNLKNMTDKTVLIVTHRLKALEICNRVLDVNEDVIMEKIRN